MAKFHNRNQWGETGYRVWVKARGTNFKYGSDSGVTVQAKDSGSALIKARKATKNKHGVLFGTTATRVIRERNR